MITFVTLALDALFFLPDSLLCYRKVSDTQAVCYPTSTQQVVSFSADTIVEYQWQRIT